MLNCKVSSLQVLYLGMPFGGDAPWLNFWDQVVNRIKSRMSSWKSRNLSFGCRLVLIKSVLTSIPVYMRFPSSKLPQVSFPLLNLFLIFFWVGVRIKGNYLR